MRRIALFLMPLSLLFISSGCSTLNQLGNTQKALENCKFSLQAIEPSINVSMNGFTPSMNVALNVTVGVENTTDFDLAINRLDLKLFLDDQQLATASNTKYVNIPKGQKSDMHMTLVLDPSVISKQLVDRLRSGHLKYRAVATFYFKVLGLDIPISKTLVKDTL